MAHHLSNINTRHRLTQIIILVLLILAGILFSQVADARPYYKPKFDRPKYRISVHKNANRSCYILFKKRTSAPKKSLFSFLKHSKNTSRPMAETDAGSSDTATK